MRPLRSGAVIIVLVLIGGCAGPITGPQAFRGLGPCLPPEISSQFFFWPVVALRSVSLHTEDGEVTSASWVLYRRGKAAVAVMWVHSDVIAVDPDPDTDTPEWIDTSLVTRVEGELVLRRDPETPCQWTREENRTDASLPALGVAAHERTATPSASMRSGRASNGAPVIPPTLVRTPRYTRSGSWGRRCWPVTARTRGCSRH